MPTGYTTVSATLLADATGTKIANATIYFTPCNAKGVPISFRSGGSGQVIDQPVSATVTTGAFSIVLADTTLTTPVNVGYLVTCVDNLSGKQLLGPGYIIQPSGSTWSFDAFIPNIGVLATIQIGPQGNSFTVRGAWAATTAYNLLDIVTYSGSSYTPIVVFTSGATFNAANWTLIAAGGTLTGTLSVPLVAPEGATITGGASVDRLTASAKVTVGVDVLQPVPALTPSGALFAEADATGAMSTWTDSTGVKHFEAGITVNGPSIINGTLSLPSNIDFPRLEVGTTVLQPVSGGISGVVFEEADSLGQCSRYVDQYGNTWFTADIHILGSVIASGTVSAPTMSPNSLTVGGVGTFGLGMTGVDLTPGSLQCLQLASGAYIFTVPFMGRTNIFADSGGVLTQLTFLGNNSAIAVSTAGLILFITDRDGQLELWSMTSTGASQTLIQALPTARPATLAFIITGQSNSTGHNNTLQPPLINAQAFMVNGGVRAGQSSPSTAIPAGNLTSLVPLAESADASADAETMSSGFAYRVAARLNAKGYAPELCVGVSGQNSTAYSGIAKGTQPYTNAIDIATAFYGLAPSPTVFPSVMLVHGEDDDRIQNTSYAANLATLQANYESDLKTISGQWQGIPLITSQIASWASNGTYDHAVPTTPLQVEIAAQANPGKIINACPGYFFPYTDGLHFTGPGQRWHGEYYSKALDSYFSTGDFKPLRPLTVTRSGLTVTVTFNVPKGPLVFDTTLVTQPSFWTGSLYGFEFDDGSGSPPAITAAAISGNSVILTLAASPAGSSNHVRYAYTATPGPTYSLAGPTTGPRGNLRDSDPAVSSLGNSLYNWCVVFSMTCN